MQTLTAENLNADNFIFKLKTVDGKHQIRYVDKTTGYPAIAKSPWFISSFGLSSYAKSKGTNDTITDWAIDFKAACYQTLDLKSLPPFDYEKNKNEIELFFKFLKDSEKKSVDFAHENSTKFFKKEIKKEIIEEAYVTKFIKKSDKKDNDGNPYPDFITTKIMKNIKTGSPDIVIEDLDGNSIPIENWEDIESKLSEIVVKGSTARIIIQLRPYLVNNKFGFSIKLCAIQLDNKKKNNMNSIFSFKENPVELVKKNSSVNEETHDSENEEGSEVEVEE